MRSLLLTKEKFVLTIIIFFNIL